jgi:hypothetical protein
VIDFKQALSYFLLAPTQSVVSLKQALKKIYLQLLLLVTYEVSYKIIILLLETKRLYKTFGFILEVKVGPNLTKTLAQKGN